ncbi:MAG TPA: PP2C family serine/threonine-protein phosphatase, partial [Bacillales bacterium]|nr:PP2C family serine/threonine-protein phosphatase [Bacillales bacterium]
FGVLDGCSSIEKFRSAEGETGGYLASNILARELEHATQSDDLIDSVKGANQKIEQRMTAENIDITKKDKRWGTVFVIMKVHEQAVEFMQIGDCMAFAVYQDGKIRPLTIPQTDHLEIASLLKWREGIDHGLKTAKELSRYTSGTVRENRKKSNACDGYGVLNGEEEAIPFIEYGKINKIRLKHIIMISDGMFWPAKDPSQPADWEKTVTEILKNGLDSYADTLLKIEGNDPECQTYIRLKKSDDKTGLVINF